MAGLLYRVACSGPLRRASRFRAHPCLRRAPRGGGGVHVFVCEQLAACLMFHTEQVYQCGFSWNHCLYLGRRLDSILAVPQGPWCSGTNSDCPAFCYLPAQPLFSAQATIDLAMTVHHGCQAVTLQSQHGLQTLAGLARTHLPLLTGMPWKVCAKYWENLESAGAAPVSPYQFLGGPGGGGGGVQATPPGFSGCVIP